MRGNRYWSGYTGGEHPLSEKFVCGVCDESLAVDMRPGRRVRFIQSTMVFWPWPRLVPHTWWRCLLRWWDKGFEG